MMPRIIQLQDKSEYRQSKGRNGWFKADAVWIGRMTADEPNDSVYVDVRSKRLDGEPPIVLKLSLRDAKDVGEALVRTATSAPEGERDAGTES